MERTGDRLEDWPGEHGLEITWIEAADGTRLRVLTGGNPRGPRLLCVHGFPQNAAEWRKLLPFVRDRFRVLFIDLRGFAKSDFARSGRYDLDTLAGDLAAVLEATRGDGEPGPAVLCAHDWGAPISWHLVGKRPDLVRHYVCVNGPHLGAYFRALRADPAQRQSAWYTVMFQIPGVEHLLASNGALFFVKALKGSSKRGTFTDEDLELYAGPLRDPVRVRAGLSYYRQARSFRALGGGGPRSPQIEVPTTIVWGQDDPALRMSVVDLTVQHYCPHARVIPLPGASHWVPDERPDAVADAILRE